MPERCVFVGVDFQDPNLPKYRGDCGECYASPKNEMNDCCYDSAKRLILLNERDLVIEAVRQLKGDTESISSRAHGLMGALISHQ